MYEKGRCRVGYWAGLSLQVAGRSGLVVARLPAVRDIPGSNRAANKSSWFHEILCDTQLWARAAHWLQCLGRLSLPRRWANVRLIAHYRRTQKSSLLLGLRVGGHLVLTDFGPDEPQWTPAYGWRRRWQHYKYSRGYYYYYYYIIIIFIDVARILVVLCSGKTAQVNVFCLCGRVSCWTRLWWSTRMTSSHRTVTSLHLTVRCITWPAPHPARTPISLRSLYHSCSAGYYSMVLWSHAQSYYNAISTESYQSLNVKECWPCTQT